MRIATLGFIATTLVATAIVPVANAGSRERGNGERKIERMESHQSRGYRNEGRDYDRRADGGNYRRHDSGHWNNRRYANGHRYNRWYRDRGRHYGHRRIAFRHYSRGYGSPMPVIAGGIIGGAIAHGVSGGDQGATVVGAVIGAVIASDSARHRFHR